MLSLPLVPLVLPLLPLLLLTLLLLALEMELAMILLSSLPMPTLLGQELLLVLLEYMEQNQQTELKLS